MVSGEGLIDTPAKKGFMVDLGRQRYKYIISENQIVIELSVLKLWVFSLDNLRCHGNPYKIATLDIAKRCIHVQMTF